MQNGRAADLAAVLNKVMGTQAQDNAQPQGAPGPASRPLDALYQPSAGQAAPKDLPRPVSETTSGQPGAPNGGARGPDDGLQVKNTTSIRITADEINNALLIFATPRDFSVIEAAIQKLDVAPLQVLIEAAIAEVTLTKELQYGVQYFLKNGNFQYLLSGTPSAVIAPTVPGFSFIFSSGTSTTAILSLLQSATKVT